MQQGLLLLSLPVLKAKLTVILSLAHRHRDLLPDDASSCDSRVKFLPDVSLHYMQVTIRWHQADWYLFCVLSNTHNNLFKWLRTHSKVLLKERCGSDCLVSYVSADDRILLYLTTMASELSSLCPVLHFDRVSYKQHLWSHPIAHQVFPDRLSIILLHGGQMQLES